MRPLNPKPTTSRRPIWMWAGAAAGLGLALTMFLRLLTNGTCRFWFSVRGVPTGQDAYLVMVAERDLRQYAEQELTGTLVSLRVD